MSLDPAGSVDAIVSRLCAMGVHRFGAPVATVARIVKDVAADRLGRIRALLSDPAAHEPFLRLLAVSKGDGLAALLKVAREARDDASDSDDGGYPPIVALGPDDAAEAGYDYDRAIDSDDDYWAGSPDPEEPLCDEDLEEALSESGELCGSERDAVRRAVHAKSLGVEIPLDDFFGGESPPGHYGAGELMEFVADELEAVKARNLEDDIELEAEVEGETSSEDEDEARTMVQMLEESQAALDVLHPAGVKRPRLDASTASREAVEAELEALELEIEAAEDESGDLGANVSALWDLLYSSYDAVRGEVDEDEANPRLKEGAFVAENAEEVLAEFEAGDQILGSRVYAATVALKAGIEGIVAAAAAEDRPYLKRKLAESEAQNEILAERRSESPVINRRVFSALVREIGQDFRTDLDFTHEAFAALQGAAEDYLVRTFGAAGLAAAHAQRTEIWPADMQFVLHVRADVDPTAQQWAGRMSGRAPRQ